MMKKILSLILNKSIEDKSLAFIKERVVKKLPQSIHRYSAINDHIKSSLKDSYLWFSSVKEFNDPFELYRELIDFTPRTEMDIRNLLNRFKKNPDANPEVLDKLVKHYKMNPQEINKAYSEGFEEVIKNIGICCFSLRSNNMLLWSHYGDKHKGICFTYDPLVDINNFIVGHVNYTNKFEKLNYFESTESLRFFQLIYNKSLDWKYEEEIRIFKNNSGRIPIKRESLKEIIFGCKCSEIHIQEIKKIVSDNYSHNVTFKKIITEKNQFMLNVEEI